MSSNKLVDLFEKYNESHNSWREIIREYISISKDIY